MRFILLLTAFLFAVSALPTEDSNQGSELYARQNGESDGPEEMDIVASKNPKMFDDDENEQN